jgi:putative ABC transport system permease protein
VIALVLAMVRARPAQAFVAFVLATFAVAAAVSAPVYLAAADRAVVAADVAGAAPTERVVNVHAAPRGGDNTFEHVAPQAFAIPGFTGVFSAEWDGYMDGTLTVAPRMVYRDDVCDHVKMVSGRCFATIGEIIVSPDTAKTLGVGLGSSVPTRQGFYSNNDGWNADQDALPVQLTIVGLYQPKDPGEVYWSDQNYFDPRLTDRLVTSPVFASRPTMKLVDHEVEKQAYEVVVGQNAITADSLQQVSAGVKTGVNKIGAIDGASVTTKLTALLARTDRDRQLLADVVPVAAVPLVGLCWFVLFIAVSAGIQERRYELGLLALRGTRVPSRWWLAAGESVLPILAGSAVGYLFGHIVIRLAATLILSRAGGVPLSTGASWWVLIAIGGALVAALLAQRRPLSQRTADLLRNVESRAARWRSAVAETVVVLLAAAAVVQLREGQQGLKGVGMLAPALVVFAIGLVAARLVGPFADRVGRRALAQGRLGTGLAAYALSRRPGSQRILALLVVAIALICFSATAWSVGSKARDTRVATELGAPRVVSVADLPRSVLLGTTRTVDPKGRWAMAVTSLPGDDRGQPGSPRTLAVDSTRLAAVAEWPGTSTAAQVASLLRPPGSRPSVLVTNKDISVDLTLTNIIDGYRVGLFAMIAAVDGSSPEQDIDLGEVVSGRHTYTQNLPPCVNTCRLVGFELVQPEGRPFGVDFTLHSLSQSGKVLVDQQQFAAAGDWRAPLSPGARLLVPQVGPAADGLRVQLLQPNGNDVSIQALAGDWPSPLPMVVGAAASVGDSMGGLDQQSTAVQTQARVSTVPRYGREGALVDLEYANRAATGAGGTYYPEVWLGRNAPPDALDQLRRHGLTIVSVQSLDQQRRALDEQGPAVAVRFHLLAAGFAVLLAAGALWLVAAVDRRRRAAEVRALRAQGISRRDASASGYLAMAGVAAGLGLVAGLVSWVLVGDQIPVFDGPVTTITLPKWPSVPALGLAWLIAALVLVVTAMLAGLRLRRLAGARSKSPARRSPAPSSRPSDEELVEASMSVWEERR